MKLTFEAIGTGWEIDYDGDVNVRDAVLQRIEVFDQQYSRFREDSWVRQIANEAGVYTFPKDAKPMMDLYEKLYKVTGGCLTPLIARTIEDAGYDAQYSLRPKPSLTDTKEWSDVLRYDFPTLETREPVLLDLGAVGKGYLIDILGELLQEYGVNSYVIDAGGDMRNRSEKVLRIGLENPHNFSQVVGIGELDRASLCSSAGSRRKWGDYHHIFNPYTGRSASRILASWVVAETTMLADGLATSLFLVEPEILTQEFSFEYVILLTNGTLRSSKGWKGELFL